jgi:hypothetical protein
MTCGVVCACDDVPAKCIAVRAVVASSNKRSFVMMISVPGKFLAGRFWREGVGRKVLAGRSSAGRSSTGSLGGEVLGGKVLGNNAVIKVWRSTNKR